MRARALETNSRTFDDALRNARRSAEYHLHVRIGKKKIAKYANFQGDRFSAAGRPTTMRRGGDDAAAALYVRWGGWEVNVRRRFRAARDGRAGKVGADAGAASSPPRRRFV